MRLLVFHIKEITIYRINIVNVILIMPDNLSVICCADGSFNIDHVLIGEVGVMVFDTKARAKPIKGDTSIKYQNGKLVFAKGSLGFE